MARPPGSYGRAINISGGSSDSKIRYCNINYATEGIQIQNCTLSTPIRDNIIANCTKGIRFLDGAPNNVINNLIYSCTSIGVEILGIEGTYTLYSNTIDNCGTCIYVGGDPEAEDPTIIIRDTIVTNWTTNGIKVLYNADMDVDYIAYYPINNPDNWASGFTPGSEIEGLSSSPYETNSVMGYYYLNSDYLTYYANDGEATASDRGFDNGKYTYLPPTIFSTATTIDEDTTWDKCVDPEYLATDYVTRGYHHNRVDYLLNDVDVSVTDGTLTIEPGVVTAVYSSNTTSKRLLITTGSGTNGKINCSGLKANGEIDYPIFTSKKQASMLVETNASSLDYTTGIRLEGTETDNAVKFTRFLYLRNGLNLGKDSNYEAKDCIFTFCDKGMATWGYDIKTRNHLFYYNNHAVYVNSTTSGKTHEFYNLTCDRKMGYNGNGIYLYAWTGDTIKVYDTLFSNLNYGIKYDSYAGTITTDYCRYFKTTYNISGSFAIGDNSVDMGDTTNTPYDTTATAWADRWFLGQSKTGEDGCIDAGTRDAYTGRMSKHTTNYADYLTDTGILDIGYHYWVFKDDDEDGINDYWEVAHTIDDPEDDPDLDQLKNLDEYILGTNPLDWDTDGDGLSDGWEAYWNAQAGSTYGKLDALNTHTTGDPDDLADDDEDGLTNKEEQDLGTDPNNPDTDGDGINDNIDPNPTNRLAIISMYPGEFPWTDPLTVKEPRIQVRGTANKEISNSKIRVVLYKETAQGKTKVTEYNPCGYAAVINNTAFSNDLVPLGLDEAPYFYEITVEVENDDGEKASRVTYVKCDSGISFSLTINSPAKNFVSESRQVTATATFSPANEINWVKVNGIAAYEDNGNIYCVVSNLKRGVNEIKFEVGFTHNSEDYVVSDSRKCFYWKDDQIKYDHNWEFSCENSVAWSTNYSDYAESMFRKGTWYYDEAEDGIGWSYFKITTGSVTDYGDYRYQYVVHSQDAVEWSVATSDLVPDMWPSEFGNHQQTISYKYPNRLAVEHSETYIGNDGFDWQVGWSQHLVATASKNGTYRTKPIGDRQQCMYIFDDAQPSTFWSRMQDPTFCFEGYEVNGQPLIKVNNKYYVYFDLPTNSDFQPSLTAPDEDVRKEYNYWGGSGPDIWQGGQRFWITSTPKPYYVDISAQQFGSIEWTATAGYQITVEATAAPSGGLYYWIGPDAPVGWTTASSFNVAGGSVTAGSALQWTVAYKYPDNATGVPEVANSFYIRVIIDEMNLISWIPKNEVYTGEGMPLYAEIKRYDESSDSFVRFNPDNYSVGWSVYRIWPDNNQENLTATATAWRSSTSPVVSGEVFTKWCTNTFIDEGSVEIVLLQAHLYIWDELEEEWILLQSSPQYEVKVKGKMNIIWGDLSESEEVNPGSFLPVGDHITIYLQKPTDIPAIQLTWNNDKIAVWESWDDEEDCGVNAVTNGAIFEGSDNIPLIVEVVEASESISDKITFILTPSPPSASPDTLVGNMAREDKANEINYDMILTGPADIVLGEQFTIEAQMKPDLGIGSFETSLIDGPEYNSFNRSEKYWDNQEQEHDTPAYTHHRGLKLPQTYLYDFATRKTYLNFTLYTMQPFTVNLTYFKNEIPNTMIELSRTKEYGNEHIWAKVISTYFTVDPEYRHENVDWPGYLIPTLSRVALPYGSNNLINQWVVLKEDITNQTEAEAKIRDKGPWFPWRTDYPSGNDYYNEYWADGGWQPLAILMKDLIRTHETLRDDQGNLVPITDAAIDLTEGAIKALRGENYDQYTSWKKPIYWRFK